MGREKYGYFVEKARDSLYYDVGWSEENLTGSWRSLKPVRDESRCVKCGLCWLYCPDGCIASESFEIDFKYCKGCGICAEECKRNAIKMEREEL